MTTIEEFIRAREGIEKLATQLIVFVERKAVKESRKVLDDANQKLEVLKTMVANDVQVNVASRLTAQLGGLGAKIVKMEAKMPVGKRAAKKKVEKPVAPAKPDITEAPEIVRYEH